MVWWQLVLSKTLFGKLINISKKVCMGSIPSLYTNRDTNPRLNSMPNDRYPTTAFAAASQSKKYSSFRELCYIKLLWVSTAGDPKALSWKIKSNLIVTITFVIVPKKVVICNSIFWAPLKIEVFPFFLGDVLGSWGPSRAEWDLGQNLSPNNVSFFRIWLDQAKCSSFNGLI